MSTIANQSMRQVMLSFAYLAYCGEQITTANPESTILGYINKGIPQIPPIATGWSVVWGPVAYTVPGALYQDNLMFIAQNSATSQYVIAVRGTNFVSDLDWLMEDFDILQQMPWPPGSTASSGSPMISESTSIDLQIVLAMEDKMFNGGTLLDFLSAAAKNRSITLCVTGHSLGGCLASALALYLKQNQKNWDNWQKKSIVSGITFAAPTAGNAAFAALYSVFEGGPYPKGWDETIGSSFDPVQCNYDVAPQAWTADSVYKNGDCPVLQTYAGNGDFTTANIGFNAQYLDAGSDAAYNLLVPSFMPMLQSKFAGLGYTQPGVTSNSALQGVFEPGLGTPLVAPGKGDWFGNNSLLAVFEAFVAQAAWQHGGSYPNVLGVTELLNPAIIPKT